MHFYFCNTVNRHITHKEVVIINSVVKLKQVVYADILIIVNTYINYFLLRLTALISRKRASTLRLVIASVVGSLYSLIIMIDSISDWLLASSRIIFACLIVILAFRINTKKLFFRLFLSFFAVSFIFAGIMYAVWFLFSPKAMYYGNGVVYFNINTFTLAVLTVLAYFIIRVTVKAVEFKAPKNTLFQVEFMIQGSFFKDQGFLDTGNSLKEPFSDFPVAVVYKEICTPESQTKLSEIFELNEDKIRYIPCSNIAGKSVLKALKPDYIAVKGIETEFKTNEVYLALSERKIHGGDINVLLNPKIFENNTNETEKDYV